jgi:hypothetical protein
MAFSEFETKRLEKLVGALVEERRPPPHLRSEVDLKFRIEDLSLEIFEVRASWRGDGTTTENLLAKTTYVKTKNLWRVFWLRSDLKWHSHPRVPQVGTIEEFLALVAEDEGSYFFG